MIQLSTAVILCCKRQKMTVFCVFVVLCARIAFLLIDVVAYVRCNQEAVKSVAKKCKDLQTNERYLQWKIHVWPLCLFLNVLWIANIFCIYRDFFALRECSLQMQKEVPSPFFQGLLSFCSSWTWKQSYWIFLYDSESICDSVICF